jgi:hypothetical protein
VKETVVLDLLGFGQALDSRLPLCFSVFLFL